MLVQEPWNTIFSMGRKRLWLLPVLLAACIDPSLDAAIDEPVAAEQRVGPRRTSGPLAGGQREILVESITAVENAAFTRSGRLLVTGDEGIYELTRGEGAGLVAQNRQPHPPCKFGGIAQLRGHVYVNCYDNVRSFLFAAPEDTLRFERIGEIRGVMLANGLSADDAGHLYVSATTQGKIVRLAIAADDPGKIAAQAVYRGNTGGLLPNGLEIYAGALFWGDFGTLRCAPLEQPLARAEEVISVLSFIDDLHVDDERILVANFLSGTVMAFDHQGRRIDETPPAFESPSAVLPAEGRLGFGANDLIVTEKGGSRVSVFRLGT